MCGGGGVYPMVSQNDKMEFNHHAMSIEKFFKSGFSFFTSAMQHKNACRKYMYKGFWFLKWEIHYMRLHTVKNKSIKQSINHLPTVIIHVMDSLCCLEHDRWQSAYHSMETERRLFIDYYLLLRAHFDWKLKIKGI